ncbi:hypothetical protein GCM10017083_17260 [Thalassobaculum fulvum]|uniref:Glycosyl transferase family 1 domain-containing protein n=1 Tax=Thalassobaculum fulvum TaxID=1633335 RepID=A0A919CNW3_9PROT|nr:glycosyltransferase [Thalassobaculum fulvum]GHD47194.1 hypothetical protein GCM10017083_17260 [Thalassobaculum fulvum]
MARVLFGMIDNRTRPIGGVKVIYQAVGALRRRGIDAYVASGVGMPEWLAGSRAIRDVEIVDMSKPQRLEADDLYVATDAIGPHRMEFMLARPDRRVLFVQNHNAIPTNTAVDWSRLTHIRCLTVSQYSRRYLMEEAGFRQVDVVSPGVDLEVFRPGRERRHRIAYMPRKWPGLAERFRQHVAGSVEWYPIENATEQETADILGGSSIFLNLGRNEGLGLPPLEAMAAGCIVCGFAGEGTTDFASPENGFWAAEGDMRGCLQAVADAAAAAGNPARAEAIVRNGQETAARYSLAAFEEALAAYIRRLL